MIVTATLAGRRYGAAVAGLILGLPIVSGPISVFVAVEQGIGFAREAASGMLPGLIALPELAVIWVTAPAIVVAIRVCPAPGPAVRHKPAPV